MNTSPPRSLKQRLCGARRKEELAASRRRRERERKDHAAVAARRFPAVVTFGAVGVALIALPAWKQGLGPQRFFFLTTGVRSAKGLLARNAVRWQVSTRPMETRQMRTGCLRQLFDCRPVKFLSLKRPLLSRTRRGLRRSRCLRLMSRNGQPGHLSSAASLSGYVFGEWR